MKKGILLTVMVLAAGIASAQETAVAAAPAAELSAAGKLYEKAVAERASGDAKQAIQTAARIVAVYYHDQDWIGKTDLLCAELYVELDLLDQAESAARQVVSLYEGSEVAEDAAALQIEIEKLKAEMESEGSAQ